jgi:glyoxylase-like metal-dependent hydrolase (beta-lactamase superfamily II)
MADYLRSLGKLLALPEVPYYPTHGNPIGRPHDFVRALIAHRHAREAQIEACIARGLSMIAEMVPVIYSEVDARLHPAASRSVLAHLQHMVATGRVACEGDTGAGSRYHLSRG